MYLGIFEVVSSGLLWLEKSIPRRGGALVKPKALIGLAWIVGAERSRSIATLSFSRETCSLAHVRVPNSIKTLAPAKSCDH
jgi:hypothetical protein